MELKIRSFEGESDRAQVEDLERRCEVGPAQSVFLFTDTMGDPICRIRNSPMYKMLVAELDKELVGVIQGSIKLVTTVPNILAKVGYVLGLRVVPHHRRKGIGRSLVLKLEEWLNANDVDLAYMATEKANEASVRLFMDKFGYTKFRTPSILVNPVSNHRSLRISPNIDISMVKIEQAESLYRRFMGPTTEFFPHDIDTILRNKLSLGTWVAQFKGSSTNSNNNNKKKTKKSWAMVSVWNSGEIFKLRLGRAPMKCILCTKSWGVMDRLFPCLRLYSSLPDLFSPFGFYFMYGLYHEGPFSGKLVRGLCEFVHNMARKCKDDDDGNCIKIVVTEVGGREDEVKHYIPHWKLLSCPEDLWCIKDLKNNNNNNNNNQEGTNNSSSSSTFCELTKNPPTRPLFVDPREV